MKPLRSAALAALVVASIGLSAALPIASAQAAPPIQLSLDGGSNDQAGTHRAPMHNFMGGGMRGGLLALACSPDGAEALDAFFLHLSYRLDLTDAQKPLFDALRAKALTAQTTFADACAAAKPADDATTPADLVAKMKAAVAIDTARLAAINAILPDFEAFFNSLTDAQKALLDGGPGGHRMLMQRDHRDTGPGRYGRAPTPGR